MLARADVIPDFKAIFAEFHPKVLRYLSKMIGPVEAEDVAQIVFLRVHSGFADFRGEASLATWIFRIATNAAFDRLRSRSFRESERAGTETASNPESEAADLAGDTSMRSAESALIRTEMNECIRSYVGALPESYRVVLALSDLEELKNQDIADILGLSVDAVKIRLHRARRELKKRFEAGCDFYRSEEGSIACDHKAPACAPAA